MKLAKIVINGTNKSIEVPEELAKIYTDFEPLTTLFFLHNIRHNSAIVDIGANLGYYCVLAASKQGKDGKVFAFEPNPDIAPILKRNIEGLSQVTLVELALGKCAKTVSFYQTADYVNSGTTESPFIPSEAVRQISVQQITLDEFFEASGFVDLDFVKCDIQGDDINALLGARKSIQSSQKPCIICEWAPAWMARAGFSGHALIDTLVDLGLSQIVVVDDYKKCFCSIEEMKAEFSADRTGKRFCNLIAARDLSAFSFTY